jgi:hypothetical protein
MCGVKRVGGENGVLPCWTYQYPFDHESQATLGPFSTWMGYHLNDKYAGCCEKVYHRFVAWEGTVNGKKFASYSR